MSACRVAAALLFALVVVPSLAAPASAVSQSPPVSVTVDRTEVSTPLGRTFAFRSTIRNDAPVAVNGLIAHLNILSLQDGVYVDPEDWSSRRTRYLDALPAGSSTTLTWSIHAVTGGTIGLYVAVLPGKVAVLSGKKVGLSPTTSRMIRLVVAEKKTLNAGGILPLALGIPALVGLLTLGVQSSRRRQRFVSGG